MEKKRLKVFISGIGGSGTYYLAKYFLEIGYPVFGSDLEESELTQSLSQSGAEIYINQSDLSYLDELDIDLHIYSAALQTDHPERQFFASSNVISREVGEYTDNLLSDYFAGKLSKLEQKALKDVDLAPLLKIDWSAKKYIAVTGTDGKTTTSSMIYHLLQKIDKKAAMLTSLGMMVDGELVDTGLHTTTPTAQQLYDLLSDQKLEKIDYVILETTSHGLAMGRLAGAKFDIAVVTNITSEHLDYHQTWEHYFNSKARLLTHHLKKDGWAVLNPFDEESYVKLENLCTEHGIQYENIEHNETQKVALPDTHNTSYNRQNAALAIEVVRKLLPDEQPLRMFAAMHSFDGVKGRMEVIQNMPFQVIVDFAHTANSLEKLLLALREKLAPDKDLHVVFGCAGMRDKSKRAPMGSSAANLADAVYICPEDPRLESLPDINREILHGAGFTKQDLTKLDSSQKLHLTNPNGKTFKIFQQDSLKARFDAIKDAIHSAKSGDIVVICGKGHEKSLCFGMEEYEWSDQKAAKEILKHVR